jgi:hypothetical protein
VRKECLLVKERHCKVKAMEPSLRKGIGKGITEKKGNGEELTCLGDVVQ